MRWLVVCSTSCALVAAGLLALRRRRRRHAPIAIVINGPSSAGKSTLCRALLDALVDASRGNQRSGFATVAFDDFLHHMSSKYYPRSYVSTVGGDLDRLSSLAPFDGRAGFEYVEDTGKPGLPGYKHNLVFSDAGRRLLAGVHRGWGEHLKLGTNLLVDHCLLQPDWADELRDVLRESGARVVWVGVHCSLGVLEKREASRGDRPLGLARRSHEVTHTRGLPYDLELRTDTMPTSEAVAAVLALRPLAAHFAATAVEVEP